MVTSMAESASQLTPLTTDEGRRHDRTHLFVAATLYSASGSCPVNIRNMSPSGALIEGSAIAEPGATGSLRRGSLDVAVRIVWKAGRKAGVCFSSAIDVAEWMGRPGVSHQQRVDDVVRSLRTGQASPACEIGGLAPTFGGSPIEVELRDLRSELAELEDKLVGDAAVVAAHPEIQLLDIALQRLDRIIADGRRG